MTIQDKIKAEIAKRAKAKQINESKNRRAERKPLVEAKRPATRKPLVEAKKPVRTARVLKENLVNAKVNTRSVLTESINKRNRALKLNAAETATYDMLARNIFNAATTLNEATQAGPGVHGVQDNQAGVGLVSTFFDIFYGFFPDLITPLIASVQPLPTEHGYYFYMEFTAGSDKGKIKKGDVLVSPWEINTPKDYTSNKINLENLGAAATTYSKTTGLWSPTNGKAVSIEGATLEWSDANTFTGVLGEATISGGKVTETASTFQVEFTLDQAVGHEVEVSYAYDNVYVPTQVPELTANVVRKPIQAKYRTIKTNYAFTGAFGFNAEHKASLPDKLAEAAMFELRREIDMEAVYTIMNSAPKKVFWNQSAGYATGAYENHKLSFMDALGNAANEIFKTSKRVRGNVLIAGINVLTLIETLPKWTGTEFGKQINGAGVQGKLGSMPVIIVPELGVNEFAVIYKGATDNFDAGMVFAPYIPVFATDPITTDDLEIKRAFITAYGLEVVNANYFVKGEIINDPVALPVFLMSNDGTMEGLGTIGDKNLDIFG